MAGYNYRRSTAHGVQDLHRGEDVVPTGPEADVSRGGVIGMPIRAIAPCTVLARWDNDSVGGYRQAVIVNYPSLGVDVLYGHVLKGSMPAVGAKLDVWDVVAKMGTKYDSLGADVHTHVQVARQLDRAKWIKTLGKAFNDLAIDPRKVRIAAGEPDMARVPYYGPLGPVQSARITAATPFEEPNLLCGDHV